MDLKRGLIFVTYVEHHKTNYQAMLAFFKKNNYAACNSCIRLYHFLNGIYDPLLVPTKLSLNDYH